ncbi:hypothetical protein KKF82_06740 [Patescibacteria group bacterium]|uniref:Uncharacterized protein n=1 Tax=viral metagenome TaxID=1070528 RepID=A0A6M3X4M7_9ZZZZ|nr:hypothetical protein [Patescibacteria group bacterium]
MMEMNMTDQEIKALAERTNEEIAQEWDQIADECEAGSWDGYSPRLQQIIAGIARNTAANLRQTS